MHVRRFKSEGFPSLVATTRPDSKQPTVMLTAHIDVVPGEKSQFKLTEKNDRYYARGVMDMKFSVACYLDLVDRLQDELEQYDFGIMITADEEVGGRNGVGYLLSHQGYRTKVAIAPDGGDNWRLEEFAKGVQWVKLEAQGIAGHASKPWQGKNAIHMLLATLSDIQQLLPPDSKREDTLLSVGTIEGGLAPNQLAPYATAILDIRHGTMDDYQHIYPKIRKVCRKHDVKATLLVSDPPCINDPLNPFIEKFRRLITDAIGEEPGSWYGYAASDGRYFSQLNIPCVIVHPPAGGWHSKEEWISIDGLEQFNRILYQYVQEAAYAVPTPWHTPAKIKA